MEHRRGHGHQRQGQRDKGQIENGGARVHCLMMAVQSARKGFGKVPLLLVNVKPPAVCAVAVISAEPLIVLLRKLNVSA